MHADRLQLVLHVAHHRFDGVAGAPKDKFRKVRERSDVNKRSLSKTATQSTGLFVWQLKAGLKHAYN